MIKAVIFDYGGVVKNADPLSMNIPKITNISEAELEQVEKEMQAISVLAEKGFISDQEYFKRLSEIIGKPIPASAVDLVAKLYSENFVIKPEVLEPAKNLKARGIKTAILSNMFKFGGEVIREKNGYAEFEPVILSYEVGMVKPELDIYLLVVEKLGVEPEECIFIDDKERNLVPARALGIKTVLFKDPQQAIKEVLDIIKK